MSVLTVPAAVIPPMSSEAIDKVRRLETAMLKEAQCEVQTEHLIHGGVYFRTIKMQAGNLLAGALIKIPTTLIVSGHVVIYIEGEPTRFEGYHIIPASAGRKQAILAHDATDLTMLFPTSASTVEAAEAEFTDEAATLASRTGFGSNSTAITGD